MFQEILKQFEPEWEGWGEQIDNTATVFCDRVVHTNPSNNERTEIMVSDRLTLIGGSSTEEEKLYYLVSGILR